MGIKPWTKVSRVSTHDFGGYFQVTTDKVMTPAGKDGVYSIVRSSSHAVVIIPITDDGCLCLVKQHRYSINKFTIELPMGGTDGQDSLAAAKRELEEETRLRAEDWQELGRVYASNGRSDLFCEIFVARRLSSVANPTLDPHDEGMIENLVLPIFAVKEMIGNGLIDDGKTVFAIGKAMCLGIL
ncbi:MAG: NUDIX hydrolase [bacterium]